MDNIVKLIVDSGHMTRAEIAKALGKNWSQVHQWYKDVFRPNDKHTEQLQELYANCKRRKR